MLMKGERRVWKHRLRSTWMGAAFLLMASVAPAVAKQPWVEGDKLEFTLPDLQGQVVDSSDERFSGKVLLVELWATWCPPCLSEISTLIELQSKYEDRGLVIVAIAFEGDKRPEGRREQLQEFVEQNNINYLVLDGGLPEDFESSLPGVRNVRGFPVEILVDRQGRVTAARNGYGYKKRWARNLDREIESLLGLASGRTEADPAQQAVESKEGH